MKKHEIIFSIIKVPLDIIIIFSSFFIAKQIRLVTDFIPNINLPVQTIDNSSLIIYAAIWTFIYIFLFISHSIYSSKISNSKIKEIIDITRYWIYAFLFFSVFIYFSRWFILELPEIPRLIVIYAFFIWTIWIILERIFLNNLWNYLLKKKVIPKIKLLLVSNKKESEIKEIIKDIKNAYIYEIIWYINKKHIKHDHIKYLWNLEKAKKLFEKKKVDEILYIDSDFEKEELYNLWDLSRIFWVRYRYITNSFDITALNTSLSLINNIPVIEIKTTPLESIWWRFFKRFFDIIWSIVWIIVLAPLMLIVAILIKIEDPSWPIIYKNRRLWFWWKEFNLYKFRYMKWKYCVKECYWVDHKSDEALKYEKELIKNTSTRNGPLYKVQNDPRKTRIWDFIEKYSIDEIPQFFNCLIWNMSLVWPRPHQPREIEKYLMHQKRVLTIKPWITWMAQTNWREKNNFEDELALDIFYIENWWLLLDIKIILKTITTLLNR